MRSDGTCFFCGAKAEKYSAKPLYPFEQSTCNHCGSYQLLKVNDYSIDIDYAPNRFKIACILIERRLKGLRGVTLVEQKGGDAEENEFSVLSVEDILEEFPKKASEFIVRTLLNLSRLVEQPFGEIELSLRSTGKYYIFSEEGDSVLRELEKEGWISSRNDSNSWELWAFTLTTKCWEMIENLQQEGKDSKIAFVAMWFDPSMGEVYEKGVKPAIEKAGYVARRIDSKEFNNKICDEIVAEIKRCKFLVSDFSGQRGGVYFEAGYGMGQGKPVIFTVRKDDVETLHFDTRQYNHIVYESPEDLCKRLYNRIRATIV